MLQLQDIFYHIHYTKNSDKCNIPNYFLVWRLSFLSNMTKVNGFIYCSFFPILFGGGGRGFVFILKTWKLEFPVKLIKCLKLIMLKRFYFSKQITTFSLPAIFLCIKFNFWEISWFLFCFMKWPMVFVLFFVFVLLDNISFQPLQVNVQI